MCLYPFILSMYGAVSFKTAFSCIFAFFMLECALCAVGMFTSSLTENQIISALLCFGILLISYMLPTISENISSASAFTFRAFTVCAVAAAAVILIASKKITAALAVLIAIEVPLSVIYFKYNALLTGKFASFADCFAVFKRIDPFTGGVFDITAVVYFITVAALFICFTVQSENSRRWK